MLGWIIQTVVISLIFIITLHALFKWLVNTLTLPKTKDFIKFPEDKYNKIYNILATNANTKHNENIGGTTPITSLSLKEEDDTDCENMKNELINFLKNK